MENETVEKKMWVKPEIVDLDIDKTAGGPMLNGFESTTPGTLS